MQILPIASGKGGVGKSLVAANLSIALAQAGNDVILADLDLGGSNLHTILGMRAPARGIGTYLSRKGPGFDDIVLPTDYANLRFIPGDAEIPGIANLKSYQKRTLVKNLLALEADFLVLDLGSGTSYNTLDFFLLSSRGIIVSVPSMTAILNAYLFLKNSVFRLITHCFNARGPAGEYLKSLWEGGEKLQRAYIPTILPELRDRDLKGYEEFISRRDAYKPWLVMNLLDDPKDTGKAGKIRRSCLHYLGIDLDHLGVIYRDALQDTALSAGLPILVYKPLSVLSQAVSRIADKVMESKVEGMRLPAMDDVDDNYAAAEMEAEIDYETKIVNMKDLLHSGALSEGDLIETIRSQQYEISRLRKENNFLKTKIVQTHESHQARAGS